MARKILNFHPAIDGFDFPNSWKWTESDKEFLVDELKPVADFALVTAGGLAMDIICSTVLGIPLLCAPIGWLVGGIAAAAGSGEEVIRALTALESTFGMCGGMALAATDYWYHDLMVPGGIPRPTDRPGVIRPHAPDDSTPASATLRAYIRSRLADTLRSHLLEFLTKWMVVKWPGNFPDAPLRKELSVEYDKLKDRLNRSNAVPVTIGVIGDSLVPWNMHQVLCYGYHDSADGGVLYVYDPNQPGVGRQIKLNIRRDLGDRCKIWTDMHTVGYDANGNMVAGLSSKPNHLSYLFVVDYTPQTPPSNLEAGPVVLKSSDGKPRHRYDIDTEIEATLRYVGYDQSKPFKPFLKGKALPSGADASVGAMSTPLSPFTATQKAYWKMPLPGPLGERELTLWAQMEAQDHPDPAVSGPYTCLKRLPDASGSSVTAGAFVHGRPGQGEITWRFDGTVPYEAAAQKLGYRLNLEVTDALAAGATYTWAVADVNATGSVAGAGRTATATATADPVGQPPTAIEVIARGIDGGGKESTSSVFVRLPRAAANLRALLKESVKHGQPRVKWSVNNGLAAYKGTLYQGYGSIMVEVMWHHMVGTPSLRWAFSDCDLVFSPNVVVQGSSFKIPVSLVGNNDPRTYYMLGAHEPKDVVLTVFLEDKLGQKTARSLRVPAWYPTREYATSEAIVTGGPEIAEGLALLQPRVRAALAEHAGTAEFEIPMPDAPIGFGMIADLLAEDGLNPQEVADAGFLGLDRLVMSTGAVDAFPLADEIAMDSQIVSASPGVTSTVAEVVGHFHLPAPIALEPTEATMPGAALFDALVPGTWEPLN